MSILDMDDLSGMIDPEFLISKGYVTVLTNCDYVKKISVDRRHYVIRIIFRNHNDITCIFEREYGMHRSTLFQFAVDSKILLMDFERQVKSGSIDILPKVQNPYEFIGPK